ncbi:unnamed protein product [Dibothriocephalus latus]|uniref:C2H2-type domain-containing protein n=1 Tax=Dibothriocephalus latus TaxID=60516 RepID=A0A3P6TLE7_DIBLA|nr:unnamed protein product [Dibothriocephalus latus]
MDCPHCPFVTEYKHHLEYHIRNHLGSKPYKCSKCNYDLPENSCSVTDTLQAKGNPSARCLTETTSLPTSPFIPHFTLSPNPPGDRSPLFRSFQPEAKLQSHCALNSFEKAFQTLLPPPPPALTEAQTCRTANFAPPYSSWLSTKGLPSPLSGFAPSMPFLSPGLPLNFPPSPNAVAAMAAFMLSAQQHAFSSMDSLMSQHHPGTKAGDARTDRQELPFRSMPQLPKGESNNPMWVLNAWRDDVDGTSSLFPPTAEATHNESAPERPQLHSTLPRIDGGGGSTSPMNLCDGILDLSSRGAHRMEVDTESDKKCETRKEAPGAFRSRIPSCDLHLQEGTPRLLDNSPLEGQNLSVSSECPFCEIIFKNRTLFELHMRFHNPQNPFACNQCGVQTRSQVEFFTHLSEKEHIRQ